MSESNIVYRCTMLTGTLKFVEPKYWVEPVRDLRGRPISWSLMCDQGINIVGHNSREEVVLAARAAGIHLEPRPISRQAPVDSQVSH